MAKIQQTGQTKSIGRAASLVVWGSFGLGVALLSGCSHSPPATNAAPKADPLFPLPPTPMFPNPPTGAQAVPAQTSNAGGVPTIPPLHSPTNNATLASLSGQGPIGNSLAINDAPNWNRTPGQLTSDQKPKQTPITPDFLPPNPNPKIEEIPDVRSPGQGITPTASWQSSSNSAPPPPPFAPSASAPLAPTPLAPAALSDETLNRRLQERGVINLKQDQTANGLRLTCYVSRGTTGLEIVEATAADYTSAAQAILHKLETK